ncbi:hypothetical protein [Alicyclobacillus sacchari]|nr:hypothetical protein [Alicyclobacillus sacchari]
MLEIRGFSDLVPPKIAVVGSNFDHDDVWFLGQDVLRKPLQERT